MHLLLRKYSSIFFLLERRSIDIRAKKSRIADDRHRLDYERCRLDEEERRLEYEEKVTLERLGDRPMDEAEVNRNKRIGII